MAKKENKYIGYIVLSFIPLIGIVWAGVEGIKHNQFIKQVRKDEIAFEEHFVEKLNSLGDEYPTIEGPVNINSARLYVYKSKLPDDKVSTTKSSYTVQIGVNPNTELDKNNNLVVKNYELTFEFFITSDQYVALSEYYQNDYIKSKGYKDYLYETYNPNNPRKSPVYLLPEIFDASYQNICYYEYKNNVICGTSIDNVITMIDNLGEITYESKAQLDQLTTIFETTITGDQILEVTNYDAYEKALIIFSAKDVANTISKLPANEDIVFNSSFDITEARTAYDKLKYNEKFEIDPKDYVDNYDVLLAAEERLGVVKCEYYIDKYVAEKKSTQLDKAIENYASLTEKQLATLNPEKKEAMLSAEEFDVSYCKYFVKKAIESGSEKLENYKEILTNAVTLYNNLPKDKKATIRKVDLDKLETKVTAYNESAKEEDKLTLNRE